MSLASRLDVVIFGATGYTGQYVIEEMARKGKQFGFQWGIAGRAVEKLKQVLQQTSSVTGIENLSSNTETIVANITNQKSLVDMCARAKVLVNCVGPYRLYGEPVVQACLEAGTHYVDISGEPQFLETMQLRYNDQATERGVMIIGSCGFDSLIADLGVETIRQEYEKKNQEIGLIESFLSVNYGQITGGLIHYATWESAVYGFTHANELHGLRRQLFQQKLPYPKFQLSRKPIFQTTVDNQSIWAVPFPGSDRSVVKRTQYFNYTQLNKKPVRYQPYFQMTSFVSVLKLVLVGLVFSLFSKFKFGVQCLLKYPRLFSGGLVTTEGPTRADCEQATFKMKFVTYTGDRQKTLYEFYGLDAGYLGTSKLTIGCATMLLKEQDRLPVKGGVLTPAAAFAQTSLIDHLNKEGIVFKKK